MVSPGIVLPPGRECCSPAPECGWSIATVAARKTWRDMESRSCDRARHAGPLISMATVTGTFLVDGLDGTTEEAENVRISLDGTNFEIDLSTANVARLRGRLAKYVDHAIPVAP